MVSRPPQWDGHVGTEFRWEGDRWEGLSGSTILGPSAVWPIVISQLPGGTDPETELGMRDSRGRHLV